MLNFINKTFRINKSIKVRIYFPDRRARTYWVIPNSSGTVTVGQMSFIIDKDRFYLEKGVPTYVFSNQSTEPIDPREAPVNKLHTAETFNVALTSKITKEFLQSTKRDLDLPTILSIFTILGLLVVAYLMYTNMTALQEQIATLTDLLNELTGGVIVGQ